MRLPALLLFAVVLPGVAQPLIVQLADVVNLRNAAISYDGSEVFVAAGRNAAGDIQGATNIYRIQLLGSRFVTRLTRYDREDLFVGVTSLDYPGIGTRVAYSALPDPLKQEEEIRVVDFSSGADQLLTTDTEGCVKIQCVDCYTVCVRNVHMSPDGGGILYATARTRPFYTISSGGTGGRRLDIHEGSLAPSGQRVISQAGKVVFTSAAPFGPTFAPAATDVYLMNFDGTDVQPLTNFGSPAVAASHAVISTNGQWIAFERTQGSSTQVWMVRSDGSGLRQVSVGSSNATQPSISADGDVVSFLQDGQVKRANAAGLGNITRLLLSEPREAMVSGNGHRVAFQLGPISGLPGAVYTAATAVESAFEQFTAAFTPRVLFPSQAVSAGGTAPASAGSLMTAYGVNLGGQELAAAAALPLPDTLGGVQLLLEGEPMPLHASTPWQINAHVPQSRAPGPVRLVVRSDRGDQTEPITIILRASAPEAIPLVALSAPGALLAAVIYPATGVVVDAANAAPAGEILSVYALGLGVTSPMVEAGVPSPLPPANAVVMPRLQIGGRDADILFAGLTPGLAGVYQVNFRVPAELAPGYQPLRWIASDGTPTGASGIYVR